MATKKKTTRKRPPTKPRTSPAKPPAVKAGADTEPPAAVVPERSSRDDEPTVRTPVSKPPAPAPRAAKLGSPIAADRDAVIDAVYLEGIERGLSKREALAAGEDVADRLRLTGDDCPPTDVPASGFYDLRHEQDFVYPGGKRKSRMRAPGVPVRRNLAEVDTIVVHQTAVEFGVSKRAIANAGGDVELARARRALDVACHVMAFRSGYFVAAHDLDVYVNHGNRFNATSFGLEIDGRYPGLEDDPDTAAREDLTTTWGGNPTDLTDVTVAAACAAIAWLVDEAKRAGGGVRKIVSHRQSSDTRRSDPGAEIWRRVVLDFARDDLGLEVVRESKWREGRPVPTQWDPDGIGPY